MGFRKPHTAAVELHDGVKALPIEGEEFLRRVADMLPGLSRFAQTGERAQKQGIKSQRLVFCDDLPCAEERSPRRRLDGSGTDAMSAEQVQPAEHGIVRAPAPCLRAVCVVQIPRPVQRGGDGDAVFREKRGNFIAYQRQIAHQAEGIVPSREHLLRPFHGGVDGGHVLQRFPALKLDGKALRIGFRNAVDDRSRRFGGHVRRTSAAVSLTVHAPVVAPVGHSQNEQARSLEQIRVVAHDGWADSTQICLPGILCCEVAAAQHLPRLAAGIQLVRYKKPEFLRRQKGVFARIVGQENPITEGSKTKAALHHSLILYSVSPSAKLWTRPQSNGTYVTWSEMQPASCRFTL